MVIGDLTISYSFGDSSSATVSCIPGTRVPDITWKLKLLACHRNNRIVIHVGANDIHLRQSEVTKSNVKEVCKLAETLSMM